MIDFRLRFAWENVRERKVRSILTVIGIAIGITAVVSLISLGQGLKIAIYNQFEKMGANTITISSSNGELSTPMMSAMSKNPLTKDDEKIVQNVPGVEAVGAMCFTPDRIKVRGTYIGTFVTGVTINEFDYMFSRKGYKIVNGRKLTNNDKYSVIIGNDLYTGNYPEKKKIHIRDKILINGIEFRVVGAMEKIGDSMDDTSVIIPMETYRKVYDEPNIDQMIFVHIKDGFDVDKVADNIEHELLRYRHEKEDEKTFDVKTSKGMLQSFNVILNILQAVLIGIASISLLVGGVGIMNTMYTSTLERTHEIGILKSIGSKRLDILTIFLYESAILGLIGGVFGISFGYALGKLAELAALSYGVHLHVGVSIPVILVSLLFAMSAGILSGIAPAIQASRLNPVDALRYE